MKSKVKNVILLILLMLMMAGCSNDGVYSNVRSDIQVESLLDNTIGTSKFITPERYIELCNKLKLVAIPVVTISIALGILIIKIFKNDKNIQKKAISICIIVIPLLVVVIVFGTAYLYGKLF